MNLLLKAYTCDEWIDVRAEYAIARFREAVRLVGLVEFARELKAQPGFGDLSSLTFWDGLLWFDYADELADQLNDGPWTCLTDEQVDEIVNAIDEAEISVCELEVGVSGVEWTGCIKGASIEVFTVRVSYDELVALAEEEANG